MKQSIRFFSIGLLTASLLMLGLYLFDDSAEESIETIPVDDMIVKVEEEGYRVITDDEFISYSLYAEEAKDEEAEQADETSDKKTTKKTKDKKSDNSDKKEKNKKKSTKDKKKKDKKKKEKDKKVKFTIKEGYVTSDIADLLIEKKVIDDRQKFIDYMEDNDYSPSIQLGTFEVKSDASLKDLAETITTYPGE